MNKKNKSHKNSYYFYSHVEFFFIKKANTLFHKRFYLMWNFFTYLKIKKNIILKSNLCKKKKKFEQGYKKLTDDVGNPLCCLNIFSVIINKKKKEKINFKYMNCQIDINVKMRSILIDWLIDVHIRFKLFPKTLFLAIDIIDKFLALKNISRQKLQLLGISAMLIASKYEEIYAPETRDFVYIADGAYTKEDIFRMEALICVSLKYNLSSISSLNVLSSNLKKIGARVDTLYLSWYCIELTLLEYTTLKYSRDTIVISSIFLVQKILEKYYDHSFRAHFKKIKKPHRNEICEKLIESIVLLNQNKKQKLTALKRKYSSKKYGQVSCGKFFTIFL